MAAYTMLYRIATSGTRLSSFLHATRGCFTSHSTTINTKTLLTPPFQASTFAKSASIFDEQNQKKYYIFGGEGGAGKTTSAASLAVKFAEHGHPTALFSFDPTHSLSHCFDQDLTGVGGAQIRGLNSLLYAHEINPEKHKEYIHAYGGVKNHMYTLGLGKLAEHCGESTLEEFSRHDEAIEILSVMQWAESPECRNFYTRVVFDTSSKGDDLLHPILSRSKNGNATKALSSLVEPDLVRKSTEFMKRGRELIRGSTEYIITTTPTVMGVEESSRLHASLKKDKVFVRRLIVNEILPPSSTYCKFNSTKREDEMRALEMIKKGPDLGKLDLIEIPLVDGEIRGILALKSMGDFVWR